ncbi:hypothetical protein EU546_01260 [Candidatus Thorarchaeota archaeon]|nr:MAG: hypothetical protein EU546_01260 [Candidatus Thorarchaeota archaeon]
MRLAQACTILLLVAGPSLSVFSFSSSLDSELSIGDVSTRIQPFYRYSSNENVDPFNITENADFLTYSQYGAGTPASPYIIENLNVSAQGLCICMMNTTAHFIIRGCVLDSGASQYGYGALTLIGVANGQIEDNLFNSGDHGIATSDIRNSKFTRNRFNVDRLCFLSFESSNCVFSNNTQITEDVRYPVHIQGAVGFTIRDNFFPSAIAEGIRLSTSINCSLQNNTAHISRSSEYSLGAFTLRDCDACVVSDCTAIGFAIGVEIVGGADNRVIDNILSSTTWGVRVTGNDTYVANNEISALYSGIEIQSSTAVSVVTNSIQNIREDSHGVSILAGSQISVDSNYISNSGTGIRLHSSTDTDLSRNRIVDCVTGISIEEDPNPVQTLTRPERCKIQNNVLEGCGFRFDLWSPASFNHHISGNTVNGQVMGYFFNRTDEVIDGSGFGQLILAVCEDVLVKNANFVNQSTALSVQFCSDVEVTDVALFNSEVGIHIRASSQIVLNSVECSDSDIGLHVQESLEVYTYRSQFHGNNYGILVEDSPGISLYGCHLSANYLSAVVIGAHGGIIEFNHIHHNEYGLHLLRTNQALVTGNRITYNSETGIVLNRASDGNRVYGNQIGWNGINAICGGQNNHWDDGVSHGNLWSDLGEHANYEIDSDDVDRYPEVLLGNSSTAASETEPAKEYTPLDDPLLTLLLAFASCGIAFCIIRSIRKHP